MNYRRQEVIGILLCVLALCVFLSFATYNPYETPSGLTPEVAQTNIMGLFGIYTSYYLMKFSFGWGTFFLPIIMGLAGFTLFTRKDWGQTLHYSGFLTGIGIWLSLLFAWIGQSRGGMWEAEYPGFIGYNLWNFLIDIFGVYASGIIQIVVFILLISGLFHFSIYSALKNIYQNLNDKWTEWQERRALGTVIIQKNEMEFIPKGDTTESEENTESDKIEVFPEEVEEPMEEQAVSELNREPNTEDITTSENDSEDSHQENIAIEDETEIEEGDLDAEKERRAKYRQYKLPTLEYLHDPVEIRNPHSEEELKKKANSLSHALDTFGVTGRVVRISPGPVITLFEIEPAEGVRVNNEGMFP